MPLGRWSIPVILTHSNQFTMHSQSILKYGRILGVTINSGETFTLQKKIIRIMANANPELQGEVYLKIRHSTCSMPTCTFINEHHYQ